MKKVKIPFEQGGGPMFFGTIMNEGLVDIKTKHLLTLLEFSVINGNIKWLIRTETGELVTGTHLEQKIPGTNITVKPSVPLTLHSRTRSLAPEFIFRTDTDIKVYPLTSVKKKYPNNCRKIYKIFGGLI